MDCFQDAVHLDVGLALHQQLDLPALALLVFQLELSRHLMQLALMHLELMRPRLTPRELQ
jgi:hypothetical protein